MSNAAYRDAPASPMPLIVAFGGRVFGLDPHTGARRWRVDFGTQSTVRLAPVNDTAVIVRTIGVLALIATETGAVVWRHDVKAVDGLLVAPPYVHVAGGGEVRCHALHDGKVLWADEFKGEGLGDVTLALGQRFTQVDRTG